MRYRRNLDVLQWIRPVFLKLFGNSTFEWSLKPTAPLAACKGKNIKHKYSVQLLSIYFDWKLKLGSCKSHSDVFNSKWVIIVIVKCLVCLLAGLQFSFVPYAFIATCLIMLVHYWFVPARNLLVTIHFDSQNEQNVLYHILKINKYLYKVSQKFDW